MIPPFEWRVWLEGSTAKRSETAHTPGRAAELAILSGLRVEHYSDVVICVAGLHAPGQVHRFRARWAPSVRGITEAPDGTL